MPAPRLAVLAIVLGGLGPGSSALAQPGNTPALAEPAADRIGHKYILLGAGLVLGENGGGHSESRGASFGLEGFAGWAFGRYALMAWGRGRVSGDISGFLSLGVAGRTWLPSFPRLYAELRAGHEWVDIGHWEAEFEGSPNRTGAVVGGGMGLELFTSPIVTFDGRLTIDRGITLDTPDYLLVAVGLALHIY
jgi:hypothetical protein